VQEPRLELVEQVAGSIWTASNRSNLHHIGFWTIDLAGDSARLAAAGWPLELCEGPAPHRSKVLDVLMLAVTGGRERTGTEYRQLLGEANLDLAAILPTSTASVIEAHL
jgi:hypothetical protein